METKNFYICSALNERQNAQMVKSVDTLVSGTSARKGVQVRVLFWALIKIKNSCKLIYYSYFFTTSYIITYNNRIIQIGKRLSGLSTPKIKKDLALMQSLNNQSV
jgi:hypothetical protein